MSFARFKLGLRNQSAEKRAAICRQVIASLAVLPPEKRTLVRLDELQAQLAEAEADIARIAGLRAELRAAITQRKAAIRRLCESVYSAAAGYSAEVRASASELQAGGLALHAPKRPVGRPDAPASFRVARAENSGAVRLRWKRPVRRCVFNIQFTTDANGQGGWQHHTVCTGASCQLSGLEPGRLYWFRVNAVNAHGPGPWSQSLALRPG